MSLVTQDRQVRTIDCSTAKPSKAEDWLDGFALAITWAGLVLVARFGSVLIERIGETLEELGLTTYQANAGEALAGLLLVLGTLVVVQMATVGLGQRIRRSRRS